MNATDRPAGSILGHPVKRIEDPRFLSTGATYVDDVRDPLLAGAVYAHYVRSTVAHARIESIDVSEARNAPGVLAVFTGQDLVVAGITRFPADFPLFPKAMTRTFLATDTVRYVGEPVAVIITEQRSQGPDAAEAVVVDYDMLPVVVDSMEALDDAVLLFPEAGTNVALTVPATATDGFDEALAGCEVIVRARIANSKIAGAPLEPRSAAAAWDANGRLHHWVSCQGSHPYRGVVARALKLDEANVRVITPDVGGGFGVKAMPYPEDVLLGWLAQQVGRPVRWFSNRTDDMQNLATGRAQIQDVELGGDRDGTLRAYRLRVVQDAGAYPRYGAYLPNMTKMMQPGVYGIGHVAFESVSVLTNTTPVGPFRGAGRPEASAAIERAVDLFAAEIGMDPAEARRRNVLADFAQPIKSAAGTPYDSGAYREMLDRALRAAGYDDLRADQQARRVRHDPKLLGIGISTYVEVTAGGAQTEFASVEVLPTGKVRALTGSTPYGTGHETSWAMLIADRLGVSIDDIEVLHGDTDVVARGGLTGGSRSLQVAGSAIVGAADIVAERARNTAADLLEAAVEDVVLDNVRGVFHVAGAPSISKTWIDVVAASEVPIAAEFDFTSKGATFPSGAHVSVVEVDAETGKVTLLRHVACDDAGRILNPMLVAGQVHGGIAQGAAQAFLEEMVYDADGNPLTSNFSDYPVISATELPLIERVELETETPLNDLGAKGIGESGTIGATPAVHNAIIDAVAHLGVRHLDMPVTSEKIWRAISAARSA
jgi:aerobic carbon-monoxide dehydrogenase large subunit